jgi:Fe-S cluster assembly protein SufD
LNAALAAKPIRLEIESSLNEPIYLAFVWTQSSKSLMAHPRVEVVASDGIKATLVEHHMGSSTESNLTNTAIDIQVGSGASLDHIRLQEDSHANFNIGSVRAAVSRSGCYVNHHHVLGGGLARADIYVELKGEDARTELHGLVFANQMQHLDVRTCIDHQVPNTQSREDYRGIADHRGRVIFNGKVIVAKDAQRTDAAQSSRNLLLSPQAEIDTRPELEIYANDVKCAHGATVGQLDANSLFYLQSRGIEQVEARSLLTQAFATEVIERLPVPAVRDRVLARLKTRMKTEGLSL